MTGSGRRPTPHGGQRERSPDQGMRQLDGYLYWQAELAGARREAVAFCDRLPWLTTDERREVAEEYARARTEVAEAMTRRIADRCVELRAEYEARYRRLRLRMLAVTVCATSVFLACLAVVLLGS